MGTFAAGQVVIVHFPFSDLTASKLRPAVVLAEAGRGDWILCQITSKSYGDEKAIPLDAPDFAHGSLRLTSYVRPGKFSTVRDTVVRMIQKG
jgi:mRNA interferase MazF